jgi:hypothetical protein
LTAEDEARSSSLLDQSNSLLDEVYGIKRESIDPSFNERGTVDVDSSVNDTPSL